MTTCVTTKGSWDCPPGEERVLKFEAPITECSCVLYLYCSPSGVCFATVAVDVESARVRRDIFFQQRGMVRGKPKGAALEVTG